MGEKGVGAETRGGVWNPALALKQPGWCSKAAWLAALLKSMVLDLANWALLLSSFHAFAYK